MKGRLLTVNNLIYAILVFYLVAKDPLYQLQAVLFQDVILKMAYIKLSLLFMAVLIIPFFLDRIRITRVNCLLLLFVVYNFCTITFINNSFPFQERLTIFYISMFLPLFLLVVTLFGIEPGRLPPWVQRTGRRVFVLFVLLDCLAGGWQAVLGAEYYTPFYSVSLLGIIPSKVITLKEQTRSLGFFLDGIQHGLFLNFALFFSVGLAFWRRNYGYLLLAIPLLANMYLTYTRSIYVFTGLNLALFTLLTVMRRRRTVISWFLLRNYWLVSLVCGVVVYGYGITRGESDATKSLFIRFESARFILDSLTSSLRNLLFGVGYIQNSELFDEFVPDNLFLALASYGGVVALILFLALFVSMNREITRDLDGMLAGPVYLATYLLFVNIFAFGMFCNYLDSVFMFFLVPLMLLRKVQHRGAISALE